MTQDPKTGHEPRRPMSAAPTARPHVVPVPDPSQPQAGTSRTLLFVGIAVGAVVVAVLAAGSLKAFRGGSGGGSGGGGDEASAAQAASGPPPIALSMPSTAPSKVNGVTDAEILFGMASPFTGATKELGRGMKTGIEVAFAAANEAGGVNGRKLKLVALDDGYEPARTRGVMKDLVEQRKVFAIIGNVGSVTAAVSIPYILEKKVLFIGALSGAPVLRRDPPDRYVFNYRPSYTEETAAAVRYLVDVRRLKPTQIAVFSQDDDFGEAGWNGVVHQMRKYHRDPERIVKMTYKRNTADVDQAIATLRQNASQLRAVVMVATYRAAAKFIQRAKDERPGQLFFTNVSPVDSNALADELVQAGPRYTTDVLVTQIVPLPQSSATAVMRYQDLVQKYALGERAGFLSLEGYIVGNIVIEALRHVGKSFDTESLVETLEGMKGLDLGIGAPISFGPSEHQGSHKVWGTMLEPNGTYRQVELE